MDGRYEGDRREMEVFLAGDVEYPAADKTEKGITFKVNGLSPIAVGWKAADNEWFFRWKRRR